MSSTAAEERVLWQGTPSQWLGFSVYALSALAALVILVAFVWVSAAPANAFGGNKGLLQMVVALLLLAPLFFAIRRYLVISTTRYTVTTERVRITRGIFTRRTDDLELYRVDDMVIAEPFLLRLVKRGNVIAMSSDRTTPQMVLEAVPEALQLRDEMRRYVEICRDRKRTRVLDME